MTTVRTPKRKDFYIVPYAADVLGVYEHRLYCHYKRRTGELRGRPVKESMLDISVATGMSTATIQRARKVLEVAGIIKVVRGRPDVVTLIEKHIDVSVGNADVSIGNVDVSVGNEDTPSKNTDVSVGRTNVSVGNDNTFHRNELGNARVVDIDIDKELSGAALPDATQNASQNASQKTSDKTPAKRTRKTDKPVKTEPEPRPPDVLFDAIALGSFGIRDSAKVNGSGGRVGKIKAWLVKHYPGATDKTLTAFYAWYATKNPDASAPRDPEKFAEHFVAFHDEVTAKRQKQQQSDEKMAELSALYEYQQAINAAARQAAAAGKTS